MESDAIPLQPLEVLPSEIQERSTRLNQPTSTPLPRPPRSSQSSPTLLYNGHSSSNNTAQHPDQEPSSRFSRWMSEWVTDWWGVELACWVIATLSLIGIIVTLESHKHQPLPQWSFGITLNSLISILATISQMAMMKPIVECISQLKWLWFVRKERLLGFQGFDDASRGPTGSLILLGKLRGLHLVSLGAAITLVAVAFGPFAQQVVTYPLFLHPNGIATVPQVFNFTAPTEVLSPVITASIYEGLAQGNLNPSAITPICSTGNCTWSPYSSLGVCASVEDVSSTIRSNECNNATFEEIFEVAELTNPGYPCFNYTLPEIVYAAATTSVLLGPISNATLSTGFSNSSLVYGVGMMEIMSLTSAVTNSSSLSTAYLMYQPDFLTSVNSSLPSPIAYQLNLDFCIQTYNTTVSNGMVNTTMLSSQILPAANKNSFTTNNDSLQTDGNSTYVSVGENTFGISALASAILGLTLQETFDTTCFDILPSAADNSTIAGGGDSYCPFTLGFSFLNALESSTDSLSAVTELLENLAISITNTFRAEAGGDTQIGMFEGVVLEPVVLVEANYLWLLLPLGLVGLTLIFLLATISKSKRLGSRIWKSSNLATLQGLHIDLHTQLGGLSSISEMEEKAESLKVRFDMKSGVAERDVEYRLIESKQDSSWR